MGGAAPGMRASSVLALQGAEATMDRPARPHRDGDATTQDEAVADLLHLLEQPLAARGRASTAHGAVRNAGDGAMRTRRADAGPTAFIGAFALPIGVAGPLRVHGQHAQGDYRVPLATTDAALVASYTRGARLVTEAGGCNALAARCRASAARRASSSTACAKPARARHATCSASASRPRSRWPPRSCAASGMSSRRRCATTGAWPPSAAR